MRRGLTALALLLAGPACMAAGAKPFITSFGDWTVACDNVRACSAQTYRATGESDTQAGVWLSRGAGPQGAVLIQLYLSTPDGQEQPDGSRASVQVDGRSFGSLRLDGDMPPHTAQALLRALVEGSELQLTLPDNTASVSLQGLKAALLKMDDVQGRVGTVTAWVARGRAPATQVPPGPPLPVLVPAVPPAPLAAAATLPLVKQLVRHPQVVQDCYLLQEESGSSDSLPDTTLYRIHPNEYLMLMACERAPYQTGYRLWRVKQQRHGLDVAPEVLPDLQAPALDLMNAEFSEGELGTWHKGRGQGDCGGSRRWLWTAAGFALRSANEAPDCNGMFGGGNGLSQWQTEVRPAASAARP